MAKIIAEMKADMIDKIKAIMYRDGIDANIGVDEQGRGWRLRGNVAMAAKPQAEIKPAEKPLSLRPLKFEEALAGL